MDSQAAHIGATCCPLWPPSFNARFPPGDSHLFPPSQSLFQNTIFQIYCLKRTMTWVQLSSLQFNFASASSELSKKQFFPCTPKPSMTPMYLCNKIQILTQLLITSLLWYLQMLSQCTRAVRKQSGHCHYKKLHGWIPSGESLYSLGWAFTSSTSVLWNPHSRCVACWKPCLLLKTSFPLALFTHSSVLIMSLQPFLCCGYCVHLWPSLCTVTPWIGQCQNIRGKWETAGVRVGVGKIIIKQRFLTRHHFGI